MTVFSRQPQRRREDSLDEKAEIDEIVIDAKASRGNVTMSPVPDDAYFLLQKHGPAMSIQGCRQALLIVATVLSILVVFFHEAHEFILWFAVAFIPTVIFISLVNRDAFVLLEKKAPSNKVNLFNPFFTVSIALCFRGLYDYPDTNYSENSLRSFLIVGSTAVAICVVIFYSVKISGFGAVAVVSFFLSFFLVEYINATPPFSEEVVHRGKINRKYTSPRSRSHSIVIATPKGLIHAKTSLTEYGKYRVGDWACVKQKIGKLGLIIRWTSSCTKPNPSFNP